MNPNLTLVLETAISGGSIAIFERDELILSRSSANTRSRAEDVLVDIDSALQSLGVDAPSLTSILVSAGPGSFTGIRIGIATASGLARSLGVPMISSSMMAPLAGLAVCTDRVLTAIPMGRDAACIQEFRIQGDSIEALSSPESVPRADLHLLDTEDHAIVSHALLVGEFDNANVINAGDEMAALLGQHHIRYGASSTQPLFISKN